MRGPDPLPAVGKATNPYVTSPNTAQKPKQSVLSAPTAETAGTRYSVHHNHISVSPSIVTTLQKCKGHFHVAMVI